MANIIIPDRNKTGYKLGSLSAVIYWVKVNGVVYVHGCPIDNHIMIPPTEIGDNGALARQLWEDARVSGRPSYKAQGYQWNEAGTLGEVQKLQTRWIDQEMKVRRHMGQYDERIRKQVHSEVAGRLRQRMQSSSCTPFERDFIAEWLKLNESKQSEYTKKWEDMHFYNQALEFNDGHKLEDRMGEG